MSARFELEAMRIALGEMLERIDRIEREVKVRGEGEQRNDSHHFGICGECREAAPGGSMVEETATISVSPSGAEV